MLAVVRSGTAYLSSYGVRCLVIVRVRVIWEEACGHVWGIGLGLPTVPMPMRGSKKTSILP